MADIQEKVTTTESSNPQVVRTITQTTPPAGAAPAVPAETPQKAFEEKKKIFRTYQVIWYVLGLLEVILVFRLILKILGANPESGFTNLIYSISGPFTLPFNGIFPVSATEGSVLEWSTIIASIVYLIFAIGLVQLMQLVKPTTPKEVEASV